MVLLLLLPRQRPGSHGDDGDALSKA